MVFNKQPNDAPLNTMEIGFADALFRGNGHGGGGGHSPHEAHIPRILTMKDGVLAEIQDLRLRPELGTVRNWELVVTDSTQALTTEETGTFNRTTHADARDFRWISDFEGNDLHNRPLSAEINTRQLLMVLYVRRGNFYTKLQSPVLKKKPVHQPAQPVAYGKNAAVVACDITFEDTGTLKLMAGGPSGVEVKRFEPGSVYEISNSPPDVPFDLPIPSNAPGHFHMYYDKVFITHPRDEFDLIRDDMGPAPDPALCGATRLGLRTDPL